MPILARRSLLTDQDATVSELEVVALAATGEHISLRAESATLRAGSNPITLSCRVSAITPGAEADIQSSVQGLFTIDSLSFKLGQIVMTYTSSLAGSKLLMRRPIGGLSANVRMPHDSTWCSS